MSTPILMLAAHGAGDASPANEALLRMSAAVQAGLPSFDVVIGFNLGSPGYADILTQHAERQIVIVPVMISDGYFRNVVLPRAISEANLAIEREPLITTPVGTHPKMCVLLQDQIVDAFSLISNDQAPVIVVGHGTRRNPNSSQSTYRACDYLKRKRLSPAIEAAFLDEDPLLETVALNYASSDLVVAPFLLGGGGHTFEDIPDRIGVRLSEGSSLPIRLARGSHDAVIAAPVGEHPGIVDLVIETALSELSP